MKKTPRIYLPILIMLLLILSACGPSADTMESQAVQSGAEEASSSSAASDPSADEDASSYQATPEEEGQQGLHVYQVEGTPNTPSEDTVGGEAVAVHNFDENGVWFEYLGYVPQTYFDRVSENTYQAVLEDGSQQTVRYFEGGFQWITSDWNGYPRDFTQRLAD
jgi:hypothetical protein